MLKHTIMKEIISLIFKGMLMGAANVIPGVSGGTMALITGIFERLINAIKSFDGTAIKLLLSGKIKDLIKYVDFWFLVYVFLGVGVAIISLARLFEFLFEHYPVYIWSFFFGLVMASVYFVGKTIKKWNLSVIISFVIGTAVAIAISVLNPASENNGFLYLIFCGVVAVCSMILPGLSGSFVLILLGNYQLVMISAVNNMDMGILLPVVIGAGVGLIAFSHGLSWLLKKYHNQTLSTLTGFILGSLGILWPWKNIIEQSFGDKVKTVGYDWFLPEFNGAFFIALLLMIVGIGAIWLTEYFGSGNEEVKE
jgi:putative membrane protein